MLLMTLRITAVALLLLVAHSRSAQAGYIVYLWDDGPNVSLSGSGTMNLTDVTLSSGNAIAFFNPSTASVITGDMSGSGIRPVNRFTPTTSPSDFGTGLSTGPDDGSGDRVGAAGALILVPGAYVSGDPLASTNTWNNTTLLALGVTTGNYTWTWGSGANADSFELRAGVAPVPEPAFYGVIVVGGFVLCGLLKRHQNITTAACDGKHLPG